MDVESYAAACEESAGDPVIAGQGKDPARVVDGAGGRIAPETCARGQSDSRNTCRRHGHRPADKQVGACGGV